MKLIRYYFRRPILPLYAVISAVISGVFTLTAGMDKEIFLRMTAVILPLLLFIRAADDFYDFDKDRGKKAQYLERHELILLAVILAVIFTALNIFFFGLTGVIAAAAAGFILLWERMPLLKPLLMPLMFLYYYIENAVNIGIIQCMTPAVCLFAAVFYSVIKGRMKK